tara:strand:- start:267 stop:545 length:279 start_codon:yes stop_codon:yes gene_type:complete
MLFKRKIIKIIDKIFFKEKSKSSSKNKSKIKLSLFERIVTIEVIEAIPIISRKVKIIDKKNIKIIPKEYFLFFVKIFNFFLNESILFTEYLF